ncbi:UbiA family prenyltransferase [Ornithinicoccus halotolerans]|uniref:UbiA family prenyltransferase n=1 Tax=Ornithinicoccus halotolerans TaxID=1748220 RepID=UPI001294DBE3|nr:UbiA family prenyltransferase [Ornithinicoccus halotolerans]
MLLGLLRACHPAPALLVTVIAGGLGVAAGAGPLRLAHVVAAVAAGQLVIGWSNDLIDHERDRLVDRTDKPLATGEIPVRAAVLALVLAVLATTALSLLLGAVPGLLHLGLVVGGGVAYNVWLKSTVWSWLPYAVAFGALPAVAWTAAGAAGPPWWVLPAGALLGVAAHVLNVLPDLADDARTGVRGMPHRLSALHARQLAVGLLAVAVVVVVLGVLATR